MQYDMQYLSLENVLIGFKIVFHPSTVKKQKEFRVMFEAL